MTTVLRRAVGIGLVAAATLALAAISRAPWRAHPEADGAVRVSLSARPDRVESCRTLTAEELAEVPAHMRQQVVCVGTAARYRLTIEVDRRNLADLALTGGGARQDRPIHVLREFPLPAGRHHLSVRMVRTDSIPAEAGPDAPDPEGERGISRDRDTRESEERDRRRREAMPVRLSLDTILDVMPGRVILVTYDAMQRRILAISSPRDP